MKKTFFIVICATVIIFILTTLTGNNYIYKALWYNFVKINNYDIFYNRIINIGTPQPWAVSKNYNKIKLTDSLNQKLVDYKTAAFLVIKNDSINYEEYWDGYSDSSHTNSFSMAKSIVSALVGIAYQEGKIKSLDDPIGKYDADFEGNDIGKITFRNLLTMTGGTNWDESYSSPFSVTTQAYYGTDLKKLMLNLKLVRTPGTLYAYHSGETQLLATVLEKIVGEHLSDYASEKLWQPLGAEHPAFWSLDHKDGEEKAYCCFNSNARDFARFGKLYLHDGNWNGKQIVDSSYVQKSLTPVMLPDEDGGTANYYGYLWWILPNPQHRIFYMQGLLGQYVIVIPDKNIVMVRLGSKRGEHLSDHSYQVVHDMVNWALKTY
jgi:CubicO group peptidase (beta-lactamase class C family)